MRPVIVLTDTASALAEAIARAAAAKEVAVVPWRESVADAPETPALVVDTSAWRMQFEPARFAAMVEQCAAAGWPFMLVSSARVLGVSSAATAQSEFAELAPVDPIGERFASAERAVAAVPAHLILRLPWLVDTPGGLLEQLLERLSGEEPVAVSDRVRGSAVQVEDVARTVVAIARQVACGATNWGVFHHRSVDHCTEAELADLLARALARAGCAVAPLEIVAEGPTTPPPAWLEGSRLTDDFGIQLRSWRHGLKGWVHNWMARDEARIRPAKPPLGDPAE